MYVVLFHYHEIEAEAETHGDNGVVGESSHIVCSYSIMYHIAFSTE